MNKKPQRKKADPVLMIGYIMIAIFMVIGFLTPKGNTTASPIIAFDLDMVRLVANILGLIVVIVLFIYWMNQIRKLRICPSCGTKAQSSDDKFCRVCGAHFSK